MFGSGLVQIYEESFSPIVLHPKDSIVFTYKVDEKVVATYTHDCTEAETIDHMIVFQFKKMFGLKRGYVFVVGERE
jgi:hypothetical protein